MASSLVIRFLPSRNSFSFYKDTHTHTTTRWSHNKVQIMLITSVKLKALSIDPINASEESYITATDREVKLLRLLLIGPSLG